MRTTINIAEDVLHAARDLAARKNITMGEVISDLARKSLAEPAAAPLTGRRNGFPQLPATGQAITSELIKSLMDDDT
jgi:hypothetical protein